MSPSTQLATSPAKQCSPWLPPELVYLILVHLWEGEPAESLSRGALLKNRTSSSSTAPGSRSPLTSHHATATLPASYHNPKAFIRLIAQPPSPKTPRDLFFTEINRLANETCRSLTLHADGRPQAPYFYFGDDRKVGVGL
ncbi:hypothetical protein GSI_12352 [Ganoderma sinense ZZ0214-1]|uniref:Uncharacterized protein n=1 Tax=Ganoderma sinense ZZ0214-1 TaxID=1077348 RepID=A0A2G8RYN4_9APHY|nr:hypothetical protein GSI_12352 [Ganoderma sinense ZZ0214-1]